jgi:hypothetical protein
MYFSQWMTEECIVRRKLCEGNHARIEALWLFESRQKGGLTLFSYDIYWPPKNSTWHCILCLLWLYHSLPSIVKGFKDPTGCWSFLILKQSCKILEMYHLKCLIHANFFPPRDPELSDTFFFSSVAFIGHLDLISSSKFLLHVALLILLPTIYPVRA